MLALQNIYIIGLTSAPCSLYL